MVLYTDQPQHYNHWQVKRETIAYLVTMAPVKGVGYIIKQVKSQLLKQLRWKQNIFKTKWQEVFSTSCQVTICPRKDK